MPDSFSRLAPFIREYIYEKKWTSLREVQEAAIDELLGGGGHLLIASPTASGKTEACFFPIISLLHETRPASVGALYVCPLKALINDQAERLAPLMEMAELPLWKWHGDVSDRHKKNLLENPSGILQITPESLEALLLRCPEKVPALFGGLAFAVIDEVHAFMGSERGSQILCQLARIEQAAGCRPRRVGLSATLGDYREAVNWLSKGSALNQAALVRESAAGRRVSIALDHFCAVGEGGDDAERRFYEAIYEQARDRRCIIFTNSRSDAETAAASLAEISASRKGSSRFLVHHGSVSAALRGDTERELRDSAGPLTAVATATLEMGIDIGKLDRVIQIGPPLSVSAFVQRLGRSGRLRGRPEIYFTSFERPERREHPVNSLPWDLLKTIATIELYVNEKWIEQGAENPLPCSLLVHQIISVLCAQGAFFPAALERKIRSLPPFAAFSAEDFRELVDHLITLDLVEKTADGEYIAGLEAGHISSRHSFYSVFPNSTEYRVIAANREIGHINFLPPEGGGIVLGGRFWQVDRIFRAQREIRVSAGEGGSRPVWRGSGAEPHRKVVLAMRNVLAANVAYPYLSERSGQRLASARKLAARLGPAALLESAQPPDSGAPRLYVLLPWLGGKGMRALLLVLQEKEHRKTLGIKSLSRECDFTVNIRSTLPADHFRQALTEILRNFNTAESLYPLIDPAQIPLTGKFDLYLPPAMLARQYAAAMLDAGELGELVI